MKNVIFLLILASMTSGCATTHDIEWHREQDRYKAQCDKWYETTGKKKFERKKGEEFLPVQDIMVARCSENPELCDPPRKPSSLKYYEHYWSVEETGEHCSDFPNFVNK